MAKDKEFYNRESRRYSERRYPARSTTYVHFFFKKRLSILLRLLRSRFDGKTGVSLIEIGCADGVVLREIDSRMGAIFSGMVGIDTAEDMIKVAQSRASSDKIRYFVRGQEPFDVEYSAAVEVGVANYTDFDAELEYAAKALVPDGHYFLSIAGKGSVNEILGRGTGYQNLLSYDEYETRIRRYFDVKDAVPVGIFVPFLWAIPSLGRAIQPIIEFMFGWAPNLYHEKVYALKKKIV